MLNINTYLAGLKDFTGEKLHLERLFFCLSAAIYYNNKKQHSYHEAKHARNEIIFLDKYKLYRLLTENKG